MMEAERNGHRVTKDQNDIIQRGGKMIKKEMIAMLLAGGQGSRLGVLTAKMAKIR